MNCQNCYEKMDLYLRNELSAEVRREIQAHLKDCTRCAEDLQCAQKLMQIVSQASTPPVPRGFAERVRNRARDRLAEQERSRKVIRPWALIFDASKAWRVAVAAGVLVGLGLGILMGYGVAGRPQVTAAARGRTVNAGPALTYRLDYVAGNPSDSLSQAFAEMTGGRREEKD